MSTIQTSLETLGQRIDRLRKERSLTQQELAEAIGSDQPNVCHLLKGHCNPTFKTLRNIATALEVDLPELLADLADE